MTGSNLLLRDIAARLARKGIPCRAAASDISLSLGEFGTLMLKIDDSGADTIGLVGSEWHTHSSCLKSASPDEQVVDTLCQFITRVMEGELYLIAETAPNGAVARTIEEDLTDYEKYLPTGYTYELFPAPNRSKII